MTHSLAPRNPLLNLLRRKDSAGNLPQPFARAILLLEFHVAGTGLRDLADTEPHLQPGDEFNWLRCKEYFGAGSSPSTFRYAAI